VFARGVMAVIVGVRMPLVMGVLVIVAVIVLMRMVMGTLM
jgi:hypothetical protein